MKPSHWIARDADGGLYAYGREKPTYEEGYWDGSPGEKMDHPFLLPFGLFPEIKPGKAKQVYLEEES